MLQQLHPNIADNGFIYDFVSENRKDFSEVEPKIVKVRGNSAIFDSANLLKLRSVF